jgi:dihydroorotase
MTEKLDLIIENGSIVSTSSIEKIDIGIRNGRIALLGNLRNRDARKRFNAKNLFILPGVIDTQVHFRDPGFPKKEDFASGTKGAILGGVTTVFDMPNTFPPTTTLSTLRKKLQMAKKKAWCDYAFFIGAQKNNINQLPSLEKEKGCCGIKIFMGSSTGTLLVDDDASLYRILKKTKRVIAIHSEDEARLQERKGILEKKNVTVQSHRKWRDVETALKSTKRILKIAKQVNRKVHLLHITTKDEVNVIGKLKKFATMEVTPQHLTLAAPGCHYKYGTFAQMNPPIREKVHQAALWRALKNGTVDVIGSDHAPHTIDEKMKKYPATPSGLIGVQTLLPIMLNHVNRGNLSLKRLVSLTSTTPSKLYSIIGKGSIQKNFDADFTIVDLKMTKKINNKWIASKVGWTVFDGMKVKGWPVATVLRGSIVMRDDELQGGKSGKPVTFSK